jgi:hypothetical protein
VKGARGYNRRMMTHALLAIATFAAAQPTAAIQKPKQQNAAGGTCRISGDGTTLGVNVGPNAALPVLALTVGPGAAMADALHANKAKFTGAGKYKNEIIAVYLGKTALEDGYLGLGTVTIAADGKSGTFTLNDGKAAGSFDCGAPPAR